MIDKIFKESGKSIINFLVTVNDQNFSENILLNDRFMITTKMDYNIAL